MNGLKLGSKEKQKNSFVFENEFLDYEGKGEAQSLNDDEQDSEEDASDSYAKSSQNAQIKLPIQSNVQKGGSLQVKVRPDQGKRIKKLNSGIQKLSVSILEMREKYKDLDMEQVMFKKRSEAKEAEIKRFLDQKHEEKKALKKKIKKIRERERKKLEESINLEEENKKSIPKRRVEEHMKKLSENKQKREASRQVEQKKKQEVESMFSKIKQEQKIKKKFHLRKQEEDNKMRIAQIQEQKAYLAKRKEAYKPLDLQELDEHAKRHEELLNQLEAVKRAQKEQEYKAIVEKNGKFELLYRGYSYEMVQEELEQRNMKKRIPKQKYEKVKNYQEYVRENFLPRTHQKPNKSAEMETNRSTQSHKQVKRYRYFQGESYGEVVEHRPVAKSGAEQRKIGNQNMAYMRSLPKKRKVEEEPEMSPQDLMLLNNKLNNIVKVNRDRNPLYERSGRRSLQVKISEKPTREQLNMVMKQLKNKDEQMRMREKVVKNEHNSLLDLSSKHRDINQSIVDNIERKLNLLSKL